MRYFFLFVLIMTAVHGCGYPLKHLSPSSLRQTWWLGNAAYIIEMNGSGKDIQNDAMAKANQFCLEQDKRYYFIINRSQNDTDIFGSESVTHELYFHCLNDRERAELAFKSKRATKQQVSRPVTRAVNPETEPPPPELSKKYPPKEIARHEPRDTQTNSATQNISPVYVKKEKSATGVGMGEPESLGPEGEEVVSGDFSSHGRSGNKIVEEVLRN